MYAAPYSVFVVENHPAVREAIAVLLQTEPGIVVWGDAESGDQAIGMLHAAETTPDVALVDLELGRMTGLEFIGAVREQWPSVACVALSARCASLYRDRAVAAGASGYVEKGSVTDLGDVLREVGRRGTPIRREAP